MWVNLKPYFMREYTKCHNKEKYIAKATGFGMVLKSEENVAAEAALTTEEIIQQVMEAKFKQFKALLLNNMEMMVKLMKAQAVAPTPALAVKGLSEPPCNHKSTHCGKYKHKRGDATCWELENNNASCLGEQERQKE